MSASSWHLLVLSLPGENPAGRMRVWRALKASGAAVLRDGVYLLPAGEANRATLAGIADEVGAAGGTSYLLDVAGEDYAGLFDRTPEYEALAREINACRSGFDALAATDLTRQARKLRKGFDAIVAIDFFPGEARNQTVALLDELEVAIRGRLAPDEPSARTAIIPRRNPADYQGRLWATRKRPWVDRLASAWLIRRFIDCQARFIWLDSPAACPKQALGFDFDGAEFSHVGERVTFETLLASFDLEFDPALMRLARIVRYLDVGGLPAAEAAGLETLLAGMKGGIPDDDQLLDAVCVSLDYLYSALKERP